MRFILTVILFLVGVGSVFAKPPQEDLNDAISFLNSVPVTDQPYIKFFATSHLPDRSLTVKVPDSQEKQEIKLSTAILNVLNFWVHSLSSHNLVARPQLVPDGDGLYYIDIRDYNWTVEAWEKVARQEPNFRQPWVNYAVAPNYPNIIVRADWFIANTSETTKQADVDQEPLYYVLLYAKAKKIPSTIQEFRQFWNFDDVRTQQGGLISGAAVDFGQSGVSRHNRQLAHARTVSGYYYETSDVKNNIKEKDYLENLQPGVIARNDRNAGEAIATNALGLQVYFLCDDKGKRVEFGDPTVVWDRTDRKDVRVRTARSCISCHTDGLNPAIELVPNLISNDIVELRAYSKDQKIALEQFYLSDFGSLIKVDNEIYARAMQKCNGLTPSVNNIQYRFIMQYYDEPITLKSAALYCGVTDEEYVKFCSETAYGRIASLFKGQTIPREVWDYPDVGAFAQSMLLLNKLPVAQVKPVVYQDKAQTQQFKIKIATDCNLMSGDNIIGRLQAGSVYNILQEERGWQQLIHEGQKGWVNSNYTERTE